MENKNLIDTLSPRERDVLTLISQGFNSREIAALIFVSCNTVITHRKNILRKTGAKNLISVVAEMSRQQIPMQEKAA